MRALAAATVAVVACSTPSAKPPAPAAIAIAIASPAPGDELIATEQPMIAVTGTVTTSDPSYGILQAWVNGTPVDLDASGAFATNLAPSAGINHIRIDAGDGFGTIVSKELDVLWAEDYVPATGGTTAFAIPDALDLYLGQSFFDGRLLGTTLDLTTDPVVAHDLAAALELILWDIDLASLLASGIHVGTGSSALDLAIPSATPAQIVVDAAVSDSPTPAIELAIDLDGVFVATTGTFRSGGSTLNVAGGVSADMHASARLELSVAADGTTAVAVTNVTAIVGPLVPSFTGPDANTLDGFITVGNNDFRTLVENAVQTQLIPAFTNRIPPLLESLLGATDKLLRNVSFTLDASLGTAVTVTLDSRIAALEVVAGPPIGAAPGHVMVHQRATIATPATPIHPTSRGAARIAAAPTLPPTDTAALELVLAHDFLNALLHSLWNSGLLEGQAMFGGLTANVSAKLPPIAIPLPDASACQIDGVRCDVQLQLGQIELELPDFAQSFAIDARAGARVVVDGTTVSFVVEQTPEVVVWETSAVPGRLSTDAVKEIVNNVVWPQLFGALGAKLHFALPIPDLAALGLASLSPKLATAQLQLVVRDRAAVTAGYLGLGADIQLQAPHP